jgi:hypothetical protein
MAYLDDHPPARTQFRQRYATPTGLIVVHTAESMLDTIGEDTGAEGVADFIRRRADPGSYHRLVDSDSIVALVRFEMAAYGDGTGSNEFAIHLSFACRAADWPGMDPGRREAFLVNGARAAREAATWLEREHGVTVPARRVTRTQSEQRVAGFISHAERDPDRRTDPGPGFPWDRFLTLYAQEDDMTPKQETLLRQAAEQSARAVRMLERQRERQLKQTGRIRADLKKLAASGASAEDVARIEAGLDELAAIIADDQPDGEA